MILESILMDERQKIKDGLSEGPCRVVFTKRDGTLRTMFCTTKAGLAEEYVRKTDKEKVDNPEVCRVFDLEIKQWRSFKFDSVEEFEANVSYNIG